MIEHLPPSGQVIVHKLCRDAGVPVERVLGRDLKKDAAHLRHRCWCRLRSAGIQNSAIAKAFGVSGAAVSTIYKRNGGTPAMFVATWVSDEHIGAYMLAAEERGVHMTGLISNLLNVIAQDEMFNAILDDGVSE